MRRLSIIARGGYFLDYRSALVAHLRRAGFDAEAGDAIPPDDDGQACVVIGIHEHPEVVRSRARPLIGIQTEQLPTPSTGLAGRLGVNRAVAWSLLPYYDAILEWNADAYRHFYRCIPVSFVPCGCNIGTRAPESARHHDVVFVGKMDGFQGRRARILESVAKRFVLYPDGGNLWGDAKWRAIDDSSICLNIHFDPCPYYESPRIFDYLSRGGFVLSERMADSTPFVEGRDYVAFDGESDLLGKIRHYLSDEADRLRIAGQGQATAARYDFDTVMPMVVAVIRRAMERPRRSLLRPLRIASGGIPLAYWRMKQILAKRLRAARNGAS